MILLDDRTGSIELHPYLKPYGLSVEVCRLDSGDLSFVGNGPDGDVSIGIERKVTTDLVACIRDHRLSGFQLVGNDSQPGLLESYDYVYLIVEGVYRPSDKGGVLEHWRFGYPFRQLDTSSEPPGAKGHWETLYVGSSPILYAEVDSFLASLELRAVTRAGEPLRVRRSGNIRETARQVSTLYDNWTKKRWDQHRAHSDIYTRIPKVPFSRKASFIKPKINLVVKMAAQIDQIHSKALEIGKYFETPLAMVTASEGKWRQIDGIGKKLAQQIRKDLGHGK